MSDIEVVLIDGGAEDRHVLVKCTTDAVNFTVKFLKVPGADGDFELESESPTRPLGWLEPIGGSTVRFRLRKSASTGDKLEAEWKISDTNAKLFGRKFEHTATFDARLLIDMPASGSVQTSLTICGHIEVGQIFSSEPICFRIEIPFEHPPALSIGLPEVGLRLPRLEVAWQFPDLPIPEIWPAASFDLAPLPVKAGYRSLRLSFENGKTTLDVRGLVLEAAQQSVEADARLVLVAGQVTDASWVKFLRPAWEFPLKKWKFDHDCLMVAGEEREINQLLHWLLPELDECELQDNVRWTLRIRWNDADKKLEEFRLDLAPTVDQVLSLPGIALTHKQGKPLLVHLIFRRTDGGSRFWFVADVGTDNAAILRIPFSWMRDVDRELHKGADSAKPFELVCTPKANPLSILILEIEEPSNRKRNPSWLQKVVPALKPLDIDDLPGSCPLTGGEAKPLTKEDFTVSFTGLDGFELPFLKGKSLDVDQVINVTLKEFDPGDVDYDRHTISARFDITISIGGRGGLELEGEFAAVFNWDRMALDIDHERGIQISLPKDFKTGSLFGFDWELAPKQGPSFLLLTKDSNYQLKQLPESRFTLHFRRATTDGTAIQFAVSNFCLTPKGISLDARVTNSPAKLNALNTYFQFTEGSLQVRENSIAGFTIAGEGALPPDLVGPSRVAIHMQFAQRAGSTEIALVSADAALQCDNLLKCDKTRFQFAITALGLKFVDDGGRYHLYFTVSGMAKFVLAAGDNAEGPLGWLPSLELQLVECPLTTDTSVLARHIKFLVPLPKPKTFAFLGCFEFELRAIGFAPEDAVFSEPKAAMLLTGQIKFCESGGDAISAAVDFHDLHIGLPKKGKVFPQLYLQGLGLRITQGSNFDLAGSLDFFDEGTQFEGGVVGEGFAGRGEMTIQGLPKFTAGFAFLRVRRAESGPMVRAWFLFLQAERFSVPIPMPIMQIYLREVGLGFGYRFTLAMIKSADELSDPKQLLARLKQQAKSQGELARFEQWRVDLEEPGEGPRWTIALRALISQSSSAGTQIKWSASESEWKAETTLPCLFVIDAVAAIRSDLTFLMVGRAWLWTNYFDFAMNKPAGIREAPTFAGFLLFSPRQKRFLVNLSSNPDGMFGEHSMVFPFVRAALKNTKFSATLLVEPGLVHYELGWPNQLQWKGDFGPLKLDFRGGAIMRATTKEFVTGQSFLARGSLQFSAGVDFGCVGARLSATADVAFGARYIAVVSFEKPFEKSALYGGVGIEINVTVAIEFWIEIESFIGSITLDFHFDFAVNFTASVEIGYLPSSPAALAVPVLALADLGLRGTATLAISIMGHDIQFNIKVGFAEDKVNDAYKLTQHVLHMGLEAEEVETIPGTNRDTKQLEKSPKRAQPEALHMDAPPAAPVVHEMVATHAEGATETGAGTGTTAAGAVPAAAADALTGTYSAPSYSAITADFADQDGTTHTVFMLFPAAEDPKTGQREVGFLPVPPKNDTASTADFELLQANGAPRPQQLNRAGEFDAFPANTWSVPWEHEFQGGFRQFSFADTPHTPPEAKPASPLKLKHLVRLAFVAEKKPPSLDEILPVGDPDPLPSPAKMLPLIDKRVREHGPDAFESAVRGAVDQFTSAPYFKRSPCEYDVLLMQAFNDQTTIYKKDGQVTKTEANSTNGSAKKENVTTPEQRAQQALQMRGSIVQRLLREFREVIARMKRGEGPYQGQDVASMLLPQFGLMFRFTSDNTTSSRAKFDAFIEDLKIKQRPSPESGTPSSDPHPVREFNRPQLSFRNTPPAFENVVQYTHEGTVAIDWDLTWKLPKELDTLTARQKDPEHHLAYYHVRRRWLDGNVRDREFRVKAPSVLHREGDKLRELYPRFQFVDHFDGEPSEEVANLPAEGKRYVYTITPIDATGVPSTRPLVVAARRVPATPPPLVTESELIVDYRFDIDAAAPIPKPVKTPLHRRVDGVQLFWSPALDPAQGPRVAVAGYRLVFRREETLPIGQYAQDAEAGGPRARGLATSNARPLRTDRFVEFEAASGQIEELVEPSTRRRKYKIDLMGTDPDEIIGNLLLGIMPKKDTPWRPESWRVYLQTRSANGVYSALAPVSIRIRFSPSYDLPSVLEQAPEERRPMALEWLPNPVSLDLLPAVDQIGETGRALVPMPPRAPQADAQREDQQRCQFQRHPSGRRAVKFSWNQGPSGAAASNARYPLSFNAGYELYEFDADANVADVLNEEDPKVKDFREWVDSAQLRKIQEFELLPPEGLLVTPADTSDPKRWEAWYPSTVARMEIQDNLRARRRDPAGAGSAEPRGPRHSEAVYSPWFSWRESYLVWPPEDLGEKKLFVKVDPQGNELERPIRNSQYHPLLNAILERLTGEFERVTIDVALPPTTPVTSLEAFVLETAASADPYGWAILQRLGLSLAFTLRDKVTGDPIALNAPLTPGGDETVLDRLRAILSDEVYQDFRPHLHLELLVQPGKAMRVEPAGANGAPQSLGAEELLAVVQVSLRPAWKPKYVYRISKVQVAPGTRSGKMTITNVGKERLTLVLKSQENVERIEFNQSSDPESRLIDIRVPNTGDYSILVRCVKDKEPGITIAWDGGGQTGATWTPLAATDANSEYFNYTANDVAEYSPGAWNTLQNYMNSLDGNAPKDSKKMEFPKSPSDEDTDGSVPGIELLRWLNRFFLHAGDSDQPPESATKTGDGWWLATAYVRSSTPTPLAPSEQTGLLEYCHAIEDEYAHAYRYYFKPLGRYERLWASLAQSYPLFRDRQGAVRNKLILDNLTSLRNFQRPPPGGLDIVLDRVRPIAAPTILFSGRLDGPPPGDEMEEAFALAEGETVPPFTPPSLLGRVNVETENREHRRLLWSGGLGLSNEQRADLEKWCFDETLPKAFRDAVGRLLERLRRALAGGEPGKTWQVVIAKHPEQTLSEHNRTLARRLAYRQLAVSLLRRFQFEVEAHWLRDYTTRAYKVDDDVFSEGESLTLQVGASPPEPLTPADRKFKAVSNSVQEKLPGRALEATLDDKQQLLRIDGREKIKLLAVAEGKSRSLILNEPLIPDSRYPAPGEPPPLPGDVAPPPGFDAGKIATRDELRALDLPGRLGRFGQGAVVYEWQSLPYYYEHLLLCVAQSTNTVSPMTWALQRDFEYQSPLPRALLDAQSGDDGRYRRIRVRLENFWSCLTPEEQARWPMESPLFDDPHAARPISALPDPAVVYQYLLARPGNVTQVISQLLFVPGRKAHYEARNFHGKIGLSTWNTEVVEMLFGIDDAPPHEIYLETRLLPDNDDQIKHEVAFEFKPGDVVPNPVGTPVAGRLEIVTPQQAGTATLRWSGGKVSDPQHEQLIAWRDDASLSRHSRDAVEKCMALLLPTVVRSISSRHNLELDGQIKRARYVPPTSATLTLTARLSDQEECDKLGKLLQKVDGSETLRDIALRTQAEKFIARVNAFHKPSVGFRPTGPLPDVANETPSFDIESDGGARRLVTKAWSVALAHLDKLQAWRGMDQFDADFRRAAGELLAQHLSDEGLRRLEGGQQAAEGDRRLPDIREEVSIGLEQLRELASAAQNVKIENRTVKWLGPMDEEQWAIIQGDGSTRRPGWINVSTFSKTLAELLKKIEGATFETRFTETEDTPDLNDPNFAVVKDQVIIDKGVSPAVFSWKKLVLTAAQEAILKQWTNGGFGQTFVAAVTHVLAQLKQREVSVPIVEDDWQPRPEETPDNAAMYEKFMLARNDLEFSGLMVSREFADLTKLCTKPPDSRLIRQLHDDLLRSGLEGASFKVRAYRGGAESKMTDMVPVVT